MPALDRIALISDVHGNLNVLDAVLADIGARGINRVLNLGDYVGKLELRHGICRGYLRSGTMPGYHRKGTRQRSGHRADTRRTPRICSSRDVG